MSVPSGRAIAPTLTPAGGTTARLDGIRSAPVCGNGNRLTATAKRIGTNRPGCSQVVSVYCFASATWQAPRVGRGQPIRSRNGVITHREGR